MYVSYYDKFIIFLNDYYPKRECKDKTLALNCKKYYPFAFKKLVVENIGNVEAAHLVL